MKPDNVILMPEVKSPQVEDGYTRIANELFEAMLRSKFTSRQWQIVMAIARKTYGYNKREDDISASQIAAMCAVNRSHVTSALNQLARMNVINKRPGTHGCIVSIQKNYMAWIDDPQELPSQKRQAGEVIGHHYTYRVTHSVTGEFYTGVRSCKCHPNQDRYVGSGEWVATTNKSLLVKTILGVFDSRDDAENEEARLIRECASNPLQRNTMRYATPACTESEQGCTESEQCTESVQGVQTSDFTCTESEQSSCTESEHTKDNYPKEIQKTNSCAPQAKRKSEGSAPADQQDRARTSASDDLQNRFARFYAAYPRKKSRKVAEKSFARINPDEQLLTEMISAIGRAKTSRQWSDPQYIPHPAKWLNAEGWRDEIQTDYSDLEQSVIQVFNERLGDALGSIDAGIYSEHRAGSIRDFLTCNTKNVENFSQVYFSWIAEHCDLPPSVGFDWLISRETFTKIKGGQHERRSKP